MEYFNNLSHMMSDQPHELTNHDRVSRTATCSVCGPDAFLIVPRGFKLGQSYSLTDMRCSNDRDPLEATHA